ncbi:pilus assembly protein PilX [Acidovorax sp. SRB_14]|uniref:pilus assembly PilX family protein n=1 Tax=Acidovorax sp. SRB_14 TaxID=1962699 RepID=UPI0015648198|nr:PilX N-terminal domain-containing pilus assembly protein [Acidovorax sp. SRB_14]NMM82094.1 pilus assembly protein PilX [Acidovorax sp. SRB_14]
MQRMPPVHHRHQQQRGIALFVVIVFVMLSMLLALWASRTSLFNEMVVGNDADYQRAFEAAQALLQDAELDIRGENADGSFCTGSGDICRTGTPDKIPLEAKDVGPLLATLDSLTTKCRNGLCVKRSDKQDFWNNADASKGITLAQMTVNTIGARYGQFTGAAVGTASAPANPILADTSAATQGGWYWIEVLPYDESSKSSGLIVGGPNNLLPLNLTPSVVYRITALAYGRKPNTLVVLQQSYAQQKRKD